MNLLSCVFKAIMSKEQVVVFYICKNMGKTILYDINGKEKPYIHILTI